MDAMIQQLSQNPQMMTELMQVILLLARFPVVCCVLPHSDSIVPAITSTNAS